MSNPKAPTGDETHVRAIVFRDGDMYVAQCLEYDIVAQAPELEDVIKRLELTIEAEFAICEEQGKRLCECVVPAPNYYHDLFEKGSLRITSTAVETPAHMQVNYAKAA